MMLLVQMVSYRVKFYNPPSNVRVLNVSPRVQAVDLFPCVDQSVIENCLPFKLTHFAWSDVMRGRQSNTGDERRIEDLSSRRDTGPDSGAH